MCTEEKYLPWYLEFGPAWPMGFSCSHSCKVIATLLRCCKVYPPCKIIHLYKVSSKFYYTFRNWPLNPKYQGSTSSLSVCLSKIALPNQDPECHSCKVRIDLDCGILIKRVYFACTQATSLVLLMESQSTRPTGGTYNTTVM
jgi:hypothetical protein